MRNTTLDEIKRVTAAIFRLQYDYCGMLDSDNIAILNSGRDGENLTVEIKDVSAIETEKAMEGK